MKPGVYIAQGPVDWQILQQRDGLGEMALSGICRDVPGVGGDVYVRVLDEDARFPVIPWRKAVDAGNGRWELTLTAIPAGGLYRVETCFKQRDNSAIEWAMRGDTIHHIGVGDVFVIAGQSNAAGYGKDFVYDPPEPGIHLQRNSGAWDMASHPFNEDTRTLNSVNSEGANSGHSPYLAFARRLKKILGYPIGLIQTALGGSALSAWNPGEEGSLYRNMLDRIALRGGSIKGLLWYQGCSDTGGTGPAKSYLERFMNMVNRLRSDLGQPDLAIFTIQISRCLSMNPNDDGWSRVREAQRLAAKTPHVYVVPSIDASLSDQIHISSAANLTLGERLAAAALKNIYAKPFGYDAPDISAATQIAPDAVRLHFEPVLDRLFCWEVAPADVPFAVEDRDGPLLIRGYTAEKGAITLSLNRAISGPAVVSCAAGQNPQGYVPIDIETHCPVLPFYRFPVEG
jgi:hypothetical protein